MKSNVTSFLESLEELNNANTITIKIPSTDRGVEFKLASVSQQKELIGTVFGSEVEGAFKRLNIFNDIIETNSKEDLNFLIVDRDTIILEIRKELIGSSFLKDGVEFDLNDLKPIDMSSINLTKVVKHDGITANLAVPTLKIDTTINKKILDELSKIPSELEKIKQNFNLIISHEAAKYVVDVTIDGMTIVFDEISVYERAKIIDKLPLKLNQKIIDYVSSTKRSLDTALTFSNGIFVEIAAGFLSGD